MAYNSLRERDPLIDKETQRALERRLTEFLGIVMIACAALFSLIIFTYSPTDPGPLSASDLPVTNLLGNTGAAIASPLILVIGWGSWSLVPILLIWGLRFLLHIGSGRAIGRLIFTPIAIALSSVYAASIVPIKTWVHSFGMGGLFGDTIVGSFLTFIPISASDGILAITVISLFLTIILNVFCSGFIGSEIRKIVEFLYSSSKITFSFLAVIVVKIISLIHRKAFSTNSQGDLKGNLEDMHVEKFIPRAPSFTQASGLNLHNDVSDLNCSAETSIIIKQDNDSSEESSSGNIFSNPSLSSKISAAIKSRFQSDQKDFSQVYEIDETKPISNMLIEEKNDPGFAEYGSRIEPPLTTLNAKNLDDDNYNQASFAEIAE